MGCKNSTATSTIQQPPPQFNSHLHNSIATSTIQQPPPQFNSHLHNSTATSTIQQPPPQFNSHLHNSTATSTIQQPPLFIDSNNKWKFKSLKLGDTWWGILLKYANRGIMASKLNYFKNIKFKRKQTQQMDEDVKNSDLEIHSKPIIYENTSTAINQPIYENNMEILKEFNVLCKESVKTLQEISKYNHEKNTITKMKKIRYQTLSTQNDYNRERLLFDKKKSLKIESTAASPKVSTPIHASPKVSTPIHDRSQSLPDITLDNEDGSPIRFLNMYQKSEEGVILDEQQAKYIKNLKDQQENAYEFSRYLINDRNYWKATASKYYDESYRLRDRILAMERILKNDDKNDSDNQTN